MKFKRKIPPAKGSPPLKKKSKPEPSQPPWNPPDGKLIARLKPKGGGADYFGWQQKGQKHPTFHMLFDHDRGVVTVYMTDQRPISEKNPPVPLPVRWLPKAFVLALCQSAQLHQRHLRDLRK